MGYAQYKELDSSGVSWLQKKPSHWRIKRLKFSTDLINNKVSVEDSPLPYLGLEHIESWTGRKIEGEISNSEGLASSFVVGDLLFGKLRPYLAKVHLAQQDGLISSEALVVRSKDELHTDFLKYYMLSRDFINIVDSSTYGSKMPRASWDFIGNLPVLLPDVEEQKVIARFLDFKTAQIDALISKKKALLNKLAEKRTALISHAVTKGLDPSVAMKDSGVAWLGEVPVHWTIMRARYASTFVTSGSRGWAEYYSDSGSVFLRITNVSRDSVDLLLHDIQRVLPPESSEGERTATQSGDVLVSITADLGSVAVIPNGFESAYVSQHLALVRPNGDRIFGRWMAYQFFSASGQAQLTGSGYGGTKIQLGLGDVKDVWLALPPTGEQEEICTWIGAEVEKLKRQSDSIHDVILRLREYRSALITNAVTGKIDVRNFEIPQPAEGIAS
jgi:type I restriction enzyme, S subunit